MRTASSTRESLPWRATPARRAGTSTAPPWPVGCTSSPRRSSRPRHRRLVAARQGRSDAAWERRRRADAWSPCAVAVAPSGYRDGAAEGVSAILVGYDGSPESKLALESACDLARAHECAATARHRRRAAAADLRQGWPRERWVARAEGEDRRRRARGARGGEIFPPMTSRSRPRSSAASRSRRWPIRPRPPGRFWCWARAPTARCAACCSARSPVRSPTRHRPR